MYDKGLSVLEQYGLEAAAVYRGRGALICDTKEGMVLIREFYGTQKRLEYQAGLCSCGCYAYRLAELRELRGYIVGKHGE